MPCDNCGSAAPDNTYMTVYGGEKHCQSCYDALDYLADAIGRAETTIRQMDITGLQQLDKAFGFIRENLPEFLLASNMISLQILTTKTLAEAN